MQVTTTTSPLAPALAQTLRRFGWLILAAWMVVVFLLSNFVLPGLLSPSLNLYLLQPVVWLSLAGLVYLLRVNDGERLLPPFRREPVVYAAMVGGIQVAVGVLFGLLLGFGSTPYARAFLLMLLNLWYVGAQLAGMELARWYLASAAGRKSSALGFLLAWLLPFVMMVPLSKYSMLANPESAFRVVGQTLMPQAAESMLAAFLTLGGGPAASFAYRAVLQLYEWLSPILPDLPWLAAALVGVLVPVLGMMAISHIDSLAVPKQSEEPAAKPAEAELPAGKKTGSENAPVASWLLVLALAVAMIWLNTGVLGVQPSLISGNSMNPVLYPGDVVIVRETAPEKIVVGDVVRFHREGIDVIHRVMAVREEATGLVFITRGDNNNVDDSPVAAEQLEGKVVLSLPKVGWISIYLRQAFAWVGGLL